MFLYNFTISSNIKSIVIYCLLLGCAVLHCGIIIVVGKFSLPTKLYNQTANHNWDLIFLLGFLPTPPLKSNQYQKLQNDDDDDDDDISVYHLPPPTTQFYMFFMILLLAAATNCDAICYLSLKSEKMHIRSKARREQAYIVRYPHFNVKIKWDFTSIDLNI